MADGFLEGYGWTSPDSLSILANAARTYGNRLHHETPLRMRFDASRPGKLYLDLIASDGSVLLTLNDTWWCPPLCPGGGG